MRKQQYIESAAALKTRGLAPALVVRGSSTMAHDARISGGPNRDRWRSGVACSMRSSHHLEEAHMRRLSIHRPLAFALGALLLITGCVAVDSAESEFPAIDADARMLVEQLRSLPFGE